MLADGIQPRNCTINFKSLEFHPIKHMTKSLNPQMPEHTTKASKDPLVTPHTKGRAQTQVLGADVLHV